MDRGDAIKLIRGGSEGVRRWNKYRNEGGEIPHLREADLRKANLIEAKLRDADLSGANLSRANLSRAKLRDADLYRADLSGADLSGADLAGANLFQADLIGAKLRDAHLYQANLGSADLTRADLTRALLLEANLCGAGLSQAELRGAQLGYSVIARTDLSQVAGLETLKHAAPSSISIDTIVESKGEIPQAFLEGCGVPDNWIAYLPSLLGKPIDLYSCFISYNQQDEEFSKRLHSRMREDQLRVWFAPEDIKSGRKIHEQIDSAIKLHDKLLVVLSDHSMQSEWVATEIRKARKREKKEGKQVLFPIRLVPFDKIKDWEAFDANTGKDMADEIREYFIPDFSNWKDHDSFEESYQRLMKDFKPSPDEN